MYLQVMNTHLLPSHLHLSLPSIHHLPHCCCQTKSDHGWERDIETIIVWVHREDEEDHDDTPETQRAGEHVRDNLAAAVSAPNICVPALHEHHYLKNIYTE